MPKEYDSRSIIRNLAAAIGKQRGGAHADRIARRICRHTDGGLVLIGLGSAGECAYVYDPLMLTIYSIAVSPTAVHPTRVTSECENTNTPGPWIAANAEELSWLHPRFQPRARVDDENQQGDGPILAARKPESGK